MTGMATKLAAAGYHTAMYGKWDAGMATPDHTPHGRGYADALNYFNHDNVSRSAHRSCGCSLENSLASDEQNRLLHRSHCQLLSCCVCVCVYTCAPARTIGPPNTPIRASPAPVPPAATRPPHQHRHTFIQASFVPSSR